MIEIEVTIARNRSSPSATVIFISVLRRGPWGTPGPAVVESDYCGPHTPPLSSIVICSGSTSAKIATTFSTPSFVPR